MLDITPLILTYNEEPNIGRTLTQLRWAREVVIVDSHSDDETIEIATRFPNVRVIQRKFDSHANQWNFGLKETGIASEWILAMDADYFLTSAMVAELEDLSPAVEISGYQASFVYCINGRQLRSGIYPPAVVLYRRDRCHYRQDGHTQKLVLDGRIQTLASPILHDDRKSLRRWFHSQVLYTRLEAEKLIKSDPGSVCSTDRIRRLRVLAPLAICFYCLIIRGGIFDGPAGFYYAFQRALAELMLALYLIDHDLRQGIAIKSRKQNQATSKSLSVHPRHKRLSR